MIQILSERSNRIECYTLDELGKMFVTQQTYYIAASGDKVNVYMLYHSNTWISNYVHDLMIKDRLSTIYIYKTVTRQIYHPNNDVSKDHVIYDGVAVARSHQSDIDKLKHLLAIIKPSSLDVVPGPRLSPERLANLAKHIRQCVDTANFIMKYFYPPFDPVNDTIIASESYEDSYEDGKSYQDFVVELITQELDKNGICRIALTNEGDGDPTFSHEFVLYRFNGVVYRIESYVYLYCARVVENNNYASMLKSLISAAPGPNRVSLWNSIFGANESKDRDISLDVTLSILPDQYSLSSS